MVGKLSTSDCLTMQRPSLFKSVDGEATVVSRDRAHGDLQLTVKLLNTQSGTEIALCPTLYKNSRKHFKPHRTLFIT